MITGLGLFLIYITLCHPLKPYILYLGFSKNIPSPPFLSDIIYEWSFSLIPWALVWFEDCFCYIPLQICNFTLHDA